MSKARDTVETLRTVLVDGDIGTDVLAPDGDGSALTGVDSLPSQSGNTGKFLTTNGSAASWGTVTAGMTLLSTVTASNSSTVDIETTFDSTYDSYVIIATNVTPTADGAQFYLRMKIGGSYVTTAYNYHITRSQSSSSSYAGSSNDNHEYIPLADGTGSASSRSAGFNISISNPTSTTFHKSVHWQGYSVVANGAESIAYASGVGHNTSSTAALTGIRIYLNTGNVNSGTFRLYGIAK